MSEKDLRAGLADHLRLFAQFGAEGVSRDGAWRRRPADGLESPAVPDGGRAGLAGGGGAS